MRRSLGAAAAVAGIAIFAWISVAAYRARTSPETFEDRGGLLGWIVGPTSRSLNEAAERRIESALAALGDTSRPASTRFAAYRDDLAAAERLLLRSLRANPAQARTLARLAAIRWEIAPPADEAGTRRVLETIAAASRLAPGTPDVQMRLGELLLRMGRRGDALPYVERALDLDPASARQAVGLLREHLWKGPEIAAALPAAPAVLSALAGPFLEDGLPREWLALAEPLLPDGGKELLSAYGAVCLRSGEAPRLESRLGRIGPLGDPDLEAERWRLVSAARIESGDAAGALEAASAASALAPGDAAIAEHRGRVALRAGRAREAAKAFREALALVARSSRSPHGRARLYAAIGAAEEADGRPDLAFDAYRMAVALDPAVEPARRRLREMGRAAGVESAPDGSR